MENKEYLALELTKLTGKTDTHFIFNDFSYFYKKLNEIEEKNNEQLMISKYEEIINDLQNKITKLRNDKMGLSGEMCKQLIQIIEENAINMEPRVKEQLTHFIKHNM